MQILIFFFWCPGSPQHSPDVITDLCLCGPQSAGPWGGRAPLPTRNTDKGPAALSGSGGLRRSGGPGLRRRCDGTEAHRGSSASGQAAAAAAAGTRWRKDANAALLSNFEVFQLLTDLKQQRKDSGKHKPSSGQQNLNTIMYEQK
ncbi:DNA-directed RNA polymerase III subunit RPC9 isoform X2 [Emydura macquarii macquarii]|uniref:DNA-directed RNA polymerase III subunit RPC9 isoform X2 n=1 Tax=Emydura macquarii macquarii TaxID=1129001 RepID=UPI00352B856F